MRDPITNLVTKKLIELAIERLNDRRLANTLEAIEELRRGLLAIAIARKTKTKVGRPARKRGPPSVAVAHHMQIASAVVMLVENGLKPTRSHTLRWQKDPSACSIVCAALKQLGEHLSERTVEGIWRRYPRAAVSIHQKVRDRDSADRP